MSIGADESGPGCYPGAIEAVPPDSPLGAAWRHWQQLGERVRASGARLAELERAHEADAERPHEGRRTGRVAPGEPAALEARLTRELRPHAGAHARLLGAYLQAFGAYDAAWRRYCRLVQQHQQAPEDAAPEGELRQLLGLPAGVAAGR